MTCKTPCQNCSRTGMPILFTRYAVGYSVQQPTMDTLKQYVPRGQLQASPQGIALKAAAYNVRMLRAGYLYLLIRWKGGKRAMRGYVVHPHGYLNPFSVGQPETATAKVACERDARQANNSLVWIEDAANVEDISYFFNSDPIEVSHLLHDVAKKWPSHTQTFDVAGWLKGTTAQKDSVTPQQLDAQVVEFGALKNDRLRDACEAMMFGLMGANPEERKWGDFEVDVEGQSYEPYGGYGQTYHYKLTRKQPAYSAAHGPRLEGMRKFLLANQGAVLACNDPMGITQELGHLQAEAQVVYTAWQARSAEGFHGTVSNEWVYQSALGGEALRDLVKKGAIDATGKKIARGRYVPQMPLSYPGVPIYPSSQPTTRPYDKEEAARMQAEAAAKGDKEFREFFDVNAAAAIRAAQQAAFNDGEATKSRLGADQLAWLDSDALKLVASRYSADDSKINLRGGGAALSMRLWAALAGVEVSKAGRDWLKKIDEWQHEIFSRALSFNSDTLKRALQQAEAAVKASQDAAPLPNADPKVAMADSITTYLKRFAAQVSLGDKAIGFLEAFPAISECDKLQKFAWPLHLASLMSVKLMQGINGLPGKQFEAAIMRYVVRVSLVAMGKKSAEQAASLAQAERDRVRNAQRAMESRSFRVDFRARAPGARAAALAGIMDTGFAILKGWQLTAKVDARSGMEMTQNMLQAVGSIMDWRAKVYEETIYKGLRAHEIFTAPGMQATMSRLQVSQLRALRISAAKFLIPAAIIGAFFDFMDAIKSIDRGQWLLGSAQLVSALGAVFTVVGTGVAALSTGAWATVAAVLGVVGVVLAVVALIAIWILSEDEWVTWLRDNPLNLKRKGLKPVHDNLQDTLQQLANAQGAV